MHAVYSYHGNPVIPSPLPLPSLATRSLRPVYRTDWQNSYSTRTSGIVSMSPSFGVRFQGSGVRFQVAGRGEGRGSRGVSEASRTIGRNGQISIVILILILILILHADYDQDYD